LAPSPKRSASPVSDIDTGVVDGLKVLDPDGPIREADKWQTSRNVRFVPQLMCHN